MTRKSAARLLLQIVNQDGMFGFSERSLIHDERREGEGIIAAKEIVQLRVFSGLRPSYLPGIAYEIHIRREIGVGILDGGADRIPGGFV